MVTIKQIAVIALLLTLSTCVKFNWLNEHKEAEPNKANILSQYYCGFGDNFCGQSSDDDVAPGSKLVILAFVNTKQDGSVVMDEDKFPHAPYKIWKSHGQKVLISVGGQNGNWNYVFASNSSITNFVNSLVDIVKRFKLDGVDLDIESYSAAPRTVANTFIQLKTALTALGGKKIVTASP